MDNSTLLINKADIAFSRMANVPIKTSKNIFKVRELAFTANNVTYALCGESLRYWQFYPFSKTEGILPAWGYAECLECESGSLQPGRLLYGYWPSSTLAALSLSSLLNNRIIENSEGRSGLPLVYNSYELVDDDSHPISLRPYIPTLQPLFATSFLLFHWLMDDSFFEADEVVVTSASSKTALAYAWLHGQHTGQKPKLTAVTSKANEDFTSSTGLYERVLTYESLSFEKKDKVFIVDFLGSPDFLLKLTSRLGSQLIKASLVGATNWQASGEIKDIDKASFFFAPVQVRRRMKRWGAVKTQSSIQEELVRFALFAKSIFSLREVYGPEQLKTCYDQVVNARQGPEEIVVIKPSESS